ncbi:hypothetical protein FUSO6_04280 [Fusobacterium necrophorum DAB]|uniref:SoxR reducing system RseC family protein n=1 Tax=Fusobacterium necrophorum TaxID=859 RepID=UPI000460E4BC|nr:SoxR reducing system RseC family protein [Fusobacterium necrophorum]KDE70476.1 hypothetical protein FUSO6_04280 [Fusobacterium necrophorum DAB]
MENKGIVQKIEGNRITVKLFKDSSCSHCNQCHGASKYGKDFEFETDKKAKVGDLVTLEIAEKEVIKAAAIAYIFPPLMMIAGYLLADRLGFSENHSILGSFIGLGLAFLGLFLYDKLFAKKTIEEEIQIISVETYDPNNIENNTSCEC